MPYLDPVAVQKDADLLAGLIAAGAELGGLSKNTIVVLVENLATDTDLLNAVVNAYNSFYGNKPPA